jgi:uncharacterized protein (UPF0297 family)
MKKNKIFIQIASYRDPELLPTIKDCIEKAKYPKNLVFSIAWQHSPDDIWDNLSGYTNDKRFKIVDINYKEARGVCYARHLLQQNYNNEEYTLQLDSHHRFSQDWDEQLITIYKQLQEKGYTKPLLTGYVPSFDPYNDPAGRINIPWIMHFDRFSPEGVIHTLPATIDNYMDLTEPICARFYSAHFGFTTGKFVKEVPHDPNLYFHGEEHSISVRAFTSGYDLFHLHKVVIWHEYTRKNKKKHWDDDPTWPIKNGESFLRLRKLFEMDGEKRDIDFGSYGFGHIRTLEDYEKYSGVSFRRRSIQQYTLDKKLPPNPVLSDEEYEKSFVKIFKHCIDIGYDRVPEKDYDFWVIAFHREDTSDGTDNTLFRKDADKNEINRLMHDPDKYCKIWREFETSILPKYWVVWPHSVSKGWCERLTGNLY